MKKKPFSQQVLNAFKKIIKEIEAGALEHDIRYRFVKYFVEQTLGYEPKHIKWEKKRADLTIVDENNFAVIKIETKRPAEDITKPQHEQQAFKYEEETTKYIGLTNFLQFKLWKTGKQENELKVDLNFKKIIEQKYTAKELDSKQKTQILFLDILRKENLFAPGKYQEFNETYARIGITKEAGFKILLERLNYIANNLLLGYTLKAFGEYKEGFGKYYAELKKAEEEAKNNKKNKELNHNIAKYRQQLEEKYEKYKTFAGYELWKQYSGKEGIPDDEIKEIFCKETIYVLLNKLLFIRICEDKGFLEKNISNGGIEELRSFLKKRFDEDVINKEILEMSYKSAKGLYPHFYEIGILDWFRTGDGELNSLLNRVLWTLNQFDFTHVDRDILGNLYEKYLPSSERKKLGEFYTPVEVIDYILTAVGYTYSYDIETKELLDPACGSGGFLVRATRRLISRYLMKFGKASKSELRNPKNWKEIISRLTPDEAKIILESIKQNIYGLDINPFAGHIAEMNMLFQVIDLYQKAREKHKDYKIGRFKIYRTDSLEKPIQKHLYDYSHKAFLEEQEQIDDIKNKKFDFVVGNPPYVRVQVLDEKVRAYLKKEYGTTIGKFDIYIPFIERGIFWLKENSKLGYINPNLFLNREYGQKLKQFLLNQTVLQIIDFGDSGVFRDVTNYPCILIVQKHTQSSHNIKVFIVKEAKERLLFDIQKSYYQKEVKNKFFTSFELLQNRLDSTNWVLKPEAVLKIMESLNKCKTKLKTIKKIIHQGIITGNNDVFFIDDSIVKDFKIEKRLLKKVPKGKDVRKWNICWKNRYLIYPHLDDGTPLTGEELKNDYPNTYNYLLTNKQKLVKRKYYGKSVEQLFNCWHPLIHAKPKEAFETIKIVTPNLSKENNFSLDADNLYFDHDTYSIILKNKEKQFNEYILGLLNSKLLEFYLKQISPYASGKYYRYMTSYLEKLPIKIPETGQEKQLANQIAKMVDGILMLYKETRPADFKELLQNEETEKLYKLPVVSFVIKDDAKFEKLQIKDSKIFLNRKDYLQIKDKKTRDFVFACLSSIEEELKNSKDTKETIYNLEIPKSEKILTGIGKNTGFDKKDAEEKASKIGQEINEAVYKLYSLNNKEIEIIEEHLK